MVSGRFQFVSFFLCTIRDWPKHTLNYFHDNCRKVPQSRHTGFELQNDQKGRQTNKNQPLICLLEQQSKDCFSTETCRTSATESGRCVDRCVDSSRLPCSVLPLRSRGPTESLWPWMGILFISPTPPQQ